MTTLAVLLARLAREGFRLEARGGHIAVTPKTRLSEELRDEIIRYRADVLDLLDIHGPNLLTLFRDPPSWSSPRGRSGVLADPGAVLRSVGRRVRLHDGREGTLRAVVYDTRTGRLRCRLEIAGGGHLTLDPEELIPPDGVAAAVAESR